MRVMNKRYVDTYLLRTQRVLATKAASVCSLVDGRAGTLNPYIGCLIARSVAGNSS